MKKTQGYGGNLEKFIDPFMPRFKVITYKKGKNLVIDRYSGDEEFVGQTITFSGNRPIFGFNYYGRILDQKFSTDEVFGFLKEALLNSGEKSPYRGLNGYKKDKYSYQNKFAEKEGIIEGEEKIYHRQKLIYRLVYHGGKIKDSRSYEEWVKKLQSAEELLKRI